jgi:hypothetical protein
MPDVESPRGGMAERQGRQKGAEGRKGSIGVIRPVSLFLEPGAPFG